MDQPTAEHALARLEPLVGEWTIVATWPGGETWPGRATVEWHGSGAHLVQRASLEHPQAPDNVSIIGCDAPTDVFSCTPMSAALPRLRDEHRRR